MELEKKKKEDDSTEKAKKRLASCLRELIGERTIRKTAEESGVAASYITEILKGKRLPSANILRKLSSSDSNPQNGITIDDLMIAAGYRELLMVDNVIDEEKNKSSKERKQKRINYCAFATGVIYNALISSNMSFINAVQEKNNEEFRFDMKVDIPKQPILEWCFDFVCLYDDKDIIQNVHILKAHINKFLYIQAKLERKISLVISDKKVFDYMKRYEKKMSYRGDLSLILIDDKKATVESEMYLSNYREQDEVKRRKLEFYIV